LIRLNPFFLPYRVSRGDLPDHFHLITARADYLIKLTRDRTTMIGDDAHALADLRLVFAGGEINVAVFLR
jgi:hypothetical protein